MKEKVMGLLFLQILFACRIYPTIESYQEQKMRSANLEPAVLKLEEGELYYWEGGNPNGEPLLFLHGFGGSAGWAWARNVEFFAERYHIIAPDLLWFGESVSEQEPSLMHQTDAIQHLLAEKGIQNPNIIGLSYGGFVALELSRREPVNAMVLVGVAGWNFSKQDISRITERFEKERLEYVFVPQKKEDTRQLLDICFATPTSLVPKQLSDDLYTTVFGRYPREQERLLQELTTYNNFSYSKSSLPKKTLLIIGETDPIFSVSQAKDLAEILEGDVIVYQHSDHVPNVIHNRKFSKDVHSFFDKIEGTAAAIKKEDE